MSDTPQIYGLISTISKEAGALAPINKGGVPFSFRGVDATVSHLAPLLQKYGVIVVPTVLERTVTARDLPGNKALTQTDLLAKFTFYAPDGSSIEATTTGLAQDHSDRSTAQAQSVAFRVALLQTFTLPTDTKEPEEAGEENAEVIDKVTAAQTKANGGVAKDTIESVRTTILNEIISDPNNTFDGAKVNEFANTLTGKTPDQWGGNLTDMKKVLKALQAEVAKELK